MTIFSLINMNIRNMNIKWLQNIWRFYKIWKFWEKYESVTNLCGSGMHAAMARPQPTIPMSTVTLFLLYFLFKFSFYFEHFFNHIARLYHKTIDRSINFTIVSLYCISGWHVNSVTFDTGALFRVHEQRLASLFASLWSDMEFVFVLVFLFVFVFVFVHEQRFFCLY